MKIFTRITVTLNGTEANPWHAFGLTANPFPQIPRAEYSRANFMLQQLDSEPLRSTEDVRRILEGCDPDFIQLCCDKFKLGERVRFDVEWPETV